MKMDPMRSNGDNSIRLVLWSSRIWFAGMLRNRNKRQDARGLFPPRGRGRGLGRGRGVGCGENGILRISDPDLGSRNSLGSSLGIMVLDLFF